METSPRFVSRDSSGPRPPTSATAAPDTPLWDNRPRAAAPTPSPEHSGSPGGSESGAAWTLARMLRLTDGWSPGAAGAPRGGDERGRRPADPHATQRLRPSDSGGHGVLERQGRRVPTRGEAAAAGRLEAEFPAYPLDPLSWTEVQKTPRLRSVPFCPHPFFRLRLRHLGPIEPDRPSGSDIALRVSIVERFASKSA